MAERSALASFYEATNAVMANQPVMADIVSIHNGSAEQKKALIERALLNLRAANVLDEQVDLDSSTFLAWYDATIPFVTDIKILAGAMEIELRQRCGERIAQEGERHGGDRHSKNFKATQRVALKKADTVQRSRDRAIAAAPEAVKSYVQREAKAGRVPSVRGAVKAAKAKATKGPKRRGVPATENVKPFGDSDTLRHWMALIDKVADGQGRTEKEIERLTGFARCRRFLEKVQLIPWLTILRTPEGVTLTINRELRTICELAQPGPESSGTVRSFLRDLRAEIVRRRKEARDGYRAWRPDNIHTARQSALLDWIEDTLDKLPEARLGARARKDDNGVSQTESGHPSADA